jgi:glycosyltransferase involved in cell wall biosynthesis
MRVAFNLEQVLSRPPGGVGRYTAELARLLPEVGVDLAPFVARHDDDAVREALAAFSLERADPVVLSLPRPVLYDSWHVLGRPSLGKLARSLRDVDLVHAPSVAVPPRGDQPLVVTVHDAAPLLFPETYPRRGRWFHKRGIAAAARRADLVITVSEAAAEELRAHTAIPGDRIRIVPNGVDGRVATEDDERAARGSFGIGDEPNLLWLGSLEPRKNVETLVRAFDRWIAETGRPHLLVLAGPEGWVVDRDATLASMNAARERVRVVGPVVGDHLGGAYRGADLFAFPSRHEGFGLPVLEAMVQGTPVVAADIPALRETAGSAAVLVAPDDERAWADAFERLIADADERAAMAAAGRVQAAHFSWARCAQETRAVYEEALARSAR